LNIFEHAYARTRCDLTMRTDIADTRMAVRLNCLPIPAGDIPARVGRLIAAETLLWLAQVKEVSHDRR
jgi:hypothetical protein